MTGQNVYDQFARERDITDVSTTLFIQWLDHINRLVYRELIKADPERWITSTTYTITASPTTSTLPAGFRDIKELGTGVFERNSDGDDTEIQLTRSGFGSTSKGYYFSGASSIIFTGYTSSQVLVLRYIPTVSEITSLATTLVVPDEFIRNVQDILNVLYSIWDEDVSGETYANIRVQGAINDLLSNIRRESDVYEISSVNTSF